MRVLAEVQRSKSPEDVVGAGGVGLTNGTAPGEKPPRTWTVLHQEGSGKARWWRRGELDQAGGG